MCAPASRRIAVVGDDAGLPSPHGVGEVRHELGTAQGQFVGEGGGTALQAVPRQVSREPAPRPSYALPWARMLTPGS